jgi:HSP20 family protein
MAGTEVTRRDQPLQVRRISDWLDSPSLLLDWPNLTGWFDWPTRAAASGGDRMLRIEESFDKDTLVIRAEMPGIDPDKDVTIEMQDHTLEIRAERREEQTSEDNGTRRSEFRYGSFYRAVPLPADAKETDVKATYNDGILEVRIPCTPTPEPKRHRIAIKRH